jgi:hypothetical protein
MILWGKVKNGMIIKKAKDVFSKKMLDHLYTNWINFYKTRSYLALMQEASPLNATAFKVRRPENLRCQGVASCEGSLQIFLNFCYFFHLSAFG